MESIQSPPEHLSIVILALNQWLTCNLPHKELQCALLTEWCWVSRKGRTKIHWAPYLKFAIYSCVHQDTEKSLSRWDSNESTSVYCNLPIGLPIPFDVQWECYLAVELLERPTMWGWDGLYEWIVTRGREELTSSIPGTFGGANLEW